MTRRFPALALLLLFGSSLAGCAASRLVPFVADGTRLVSPSNERWSDEQAAGWVLEHDVVFLGELHDSDPGHQRLTALFAELIERCETEHRTLALSLEMFEQDVQDLVDDYLLGRISEEDFLADSRPWPNYAEHYRPLIELARAHRVPVVAANIPRRVASRVFAEGLPAVSSSLYTPRTVHTPPGEYRDRMAALMLGSGHGEPEDESSETAPPSEHAHGSQAPEELDESFLRLFAAQAIKDDAMADALARYLDQARSRSAGPALVLHLCGRFHSDYDLGTVERLAWRRPGLSIGTLSMVDDAEASSDERAADVLLVLP